MAGKRGAPFGNKNAAGDRGGFRTGFASSVVGSLPGAFAGGLMLAKEDKTQKASSRAAKGAGLVTGIVGAAVGASLAKDYMKKYTDSQVNAINENTEHVPSPARPDEREPSKNEKEWDYFFQTGMKTAKSIVRDGITRDFMQNTANLSNGVIAGSGALGGVVGMNLGGMSSRAGYATGRFLKARYKRTK